MLFVLVGLMAVQDFLAVPLVVAESRGRAWLAGALDAAQDYTNKIGAAICGAALVQGGFHRAVIFVSAMAVTSLFATTAATKYCRKMRWADGARG